MASAYSGPGPSTTTDRLLLRPLLPSDLNDFHAMWSDLETVKWTTRPGGTCKSLAESEEWLASRANYSNEDLLNCAVVLRTTNRLIGTVGVRQSPPAELGYMFNREVWGQGIATEAVTAFLDLYWREKTWVDRIVAFVDPENRPSTHILEKLGFSLVELRKDNIVLPIMGLRDAFLYQIERPHIVRGSEKGEQ